MKKIDLLRYLERNDKWYLGGGNRLLWAPTFPLFLDFPGFWDEAHYYNYEIKPLFTWAILDDAGRESPLTFCRRTWNPAFMTQEYDCTLKGDARHVQVLETKSLLPNDVALSVVTLKNRSRNTLRLHLVAWTIQEIVPSKSSAWITDVERGRDGIAFTKFVRPSVAPHVEIACALAMRASNQSYSVSLSERTAVQPHWALTPWFETFHEGRLQNTSEITGSEQEGLIYAGLHTEITLKPGMEAEIPIAFAASPSSDETYGNVRAALRQNNPAELSRISWNDHFASVPHFNSSDEFLTRYYWYRWYGLKLNTQYGNDGNYKRPFVCEGIGYFRAPISYSAQCHILENRWMHDPELARGSLLTFIDNQRDDGGFRGYIDMNHYRQEMFYHANWGNALLQLHAMHPSADYLGQVYEGLKKYAGYFDKERDEEISGLYDIENHYETGQEYMHRYTAVNPRADEEHWGEAFRLKGVDVTVYLYELKRALSAVAETLGRTDESELWRIEAGKIKTAVLERMWDSEQEMFFDVDPASGNRTLVKAATCFYPYFTDIVDRSHLPGLKRHLLNKKEFWTPYPVPSSSADDEFFSASPTWKGKRMNCPWNGRVWPMTNSHIAEVLAAAAIAFSDKGLRKKAAEFMTKYVRLMFFDGDPRRPNCFEHYNPESGTPSIYRGIDDYQHSWVNDLILKYVCGIRPEEFSVLIDPFPFNLDSVTVDNVLVRGRYLRVDVRRSRFTVWLDGEHHAESVIGKAIQIQI
ncbi:MAG: trehalase family glycosidase [Ignavibacteriales bacterium]|nr:trehalase family glycosidase [Ignavibacteriales bacterium]